MTTEQAATPPATQPDRGHTVVSNRVRQRLIEHAVLSVPGVVHRRAIVPGRTLPAVRVDGGTRSRVVDIEIAAAWPVDGATVLGDVETAVTRELSASLGENPQRIDVRIARIDSDRTPAQVADAYAEEIGAAVATARDGAGYGPRRVAGSTITGLLIALAVIAAGITAIREAMIAVGWIGGAAWIAPALRWAGHAQWQWWTWSAAALVVVVGAVLLVVALKPRRRAYLPVGDGVWVERHAVKGWHLEPPDVEGDKQ